MKVAIIGATGYVGRCLTDELLSRRHQLTGIVRKVDLDLQRKDLTLVRGDVQHARTLCKSLEGHDAVVHSVRFVSTNAEGVIAATRQSGVKRFLVVGGAGSLEVVPGIALVETPDFPAEYRAEGLAGLMFLRALREHRDLDWTFICPSLVLSPGERTGKFRTGKDSLLIGLDGQSRISTEDFAIAFVDEIEDPQHSRERFTVGY